MDSLVAQCSLVQLAEGEVHPPELWCHERSGALTCAYEGGERTFTWPAEDVGAIARAWRDSGTGQVPESLQAFMDAHRRLEEVAGQAGLGPADRLIHHLGRAELRGVWEKEQVVVVIEAIQPRPG